MKKLLLGLALAFAATAAVADALVTIDGIKYVIQDDGTAKIHSAEDDSLANVAVDVIDCQGKIYPVVEVNSSAFDRCASLKSVSLPNVTTIGMAAFRDCASLKALSLPSATTIGKVVFMGCALLKALSLPEAATLEQNAFFDCPLSVLLVNTDMKSEIDSKRSYYGVSAGTAVITEEDLLPADVVKNAGYVVQQPVVETNVQIVVSSEVLVQPSVTLKSGEDVLDKTAYENSCAIYGIEAEQEPAMPNVPADPTAEDFKVVSKDARVIGSDEVAVKQTELRAAKAEAVSVADGVVTLGVTVNTNGNFTAETKDWKPVELTEDNVEVKGGKIVISIPVSD